MPTIIPESIRLDYAYRERGIREVVKKKDCSMASMGTRRPEV